MNLWHDVAPHRVRPEDFLAVIEIEKGSKNKYEMDKETGASTVSFIPPHTIRRTTAFFPAPGRTTATRWTCWCSARSASVR